MIFASEKKSQRIRHALAEYVEPELIASRFLPRPFVHNRWLTGAQSQYDYRSYGRRNLDSLDLVRIYFWRYGSNFYFQRYGGTFGVDFVRAPLPFVVESVDLSSDHARISKKVIEPDDVTLDMCGKFPMGAILGSPDATGVQSNLFRYNNIWNDQRALDDLVRIVAGYLPQMEEWCEDQRDRSNVGTAHTKL